MNNDIFAIIEIGSNNTKTHVYDKGMNIYENNATIQFKNNYKKLGKIDDNDLDKLSTEIEEALKFTNRVYIFGCSIFRNISKNELEEVNNYLYNKFSLKISVVSQEDEANFTAFGCYSGIDYDKNICIFIGGGGSTELIIVNKGKVIEKRYLDFGVFDITDKFESLRADIPTCSFDEVYTYLENMIGDFSTECDVLVLAGGDHLYWYNNAGYELMPNIIYNSDNQKYMITTEMSDEYDRNAYIASLNKVRRNSDNPEWFDGSRAMKAITNVISHKVHAKYIVPTKINMEDGIKEKIINGKIE